MKAKWSEYIVVPEDTYEAEVVDVQTVENPFKDGEQQSQFKFKLHLDGTDDEVYVLKSVSPKLSSKSNFYALCEAIFREKPTQNKFPEGIDDKDLVGCKVRLLIKHRDGSDGRKYMNIATFLPSKE